MQRLLNEHLDALLIQCPEIWRTVLPLLEPSPSSFSRSKLKEIVRTHLTTLSAVWQANNTEIYNFFKGQESEFSSSEQIDKAVSLFGEEKVLLYHFFTNSINDNVIHLIDIVREKLSTKRLISYNIHSNTGTTIDSICAMDADVVLIQEIHKDSLSWLAEQAGYGYYVFGGFTDNYGIAIISRWPILTHHIISAPFTDPPRVLLCAEVLFLLADGTDARSLRIANTHLTPMSEDVRFKQMHYMMTQVQQSQFGVPDFLGGDFNSITRSDYTPQQLQQLPADRAQNPIVIDALIRDYGFIDCWKQVGGICENGDINQSSIEPVSEETSKFTAHDTMRIDYIFCHNQICSSAAVSKRGFWIEPVQQRHLIDSSSDHYPVVLDFIIH